MRVMEQQCATLQPLSRFSARDRGRITHVLCDIDDTLTSDGILVPDAYAAIAGLADAGMHVIPITGRPAGWCDHIARMWPVDGLVGENGAFFFRYDRRQKRMQRHFWKSAEERHSDNQRLLKLRDIILEQVPGCAVASDQAYREADLAIDFCEDVAPLPRTQVQRIQALFEEHGAHAKISSIHVNGWFGDYDKLSMSEVLFREVYARDLQASRHAVVFCGDSPNDAPMFGFFPFSVGVANVRQFADILEAAPAYVTESEGGAGFAELAGALLSVR